jgi:hypothetical protein
MILGRKAAALSSKMADLPMKPCRYTRLIYGYEFAYTEGGKEWRKIKDRDPEP